MEGPLAWLRREAKRLLADDPRTTDIRRAVGWASLAGAALGVVLAFVAPEPEDGGRPTPRLSTALAHHRPPARPSDAHQPPGAVGERPPASAAAPPLPPPAAAPARLDDGPTAAPLATDPALVRAPPEERPPPADTDVVASPGNENPEPVAVASVTSPAAASSRVSADRTSAAKSARRDGPGPAPRAKASASGERGADADELVWLAERAFQAGHSSEAVRLGQQALAAGAGARAQLTIAGAYFDMREFDRARSAYEAVLADEPGNQAARTGLDLSRSALARSLARAP